MKIIEKLKKELWKRQFEKPLVLGIEYALECIERVAKEDVPDEGFQIFWSKYPRHIAKKNAMKAWSKIEMSEEVFTKIISALEVAKNSSQWKSIIYIPHPATWLNGERWEDEVESTNSVPSNSKYDGL